MIGLIAPSDRLELRGRVIVTVCVRLYHGDGWQTEYLHMLDTPVVNSYFEISRSCSGSVEPEFFRSQPDQRIDLDGDGDADVCGPYWSTIHVR